MASDLTIIVDSEVLNLGFFSPIASGEANVGANVGAGSGVYRDKVGAVLNLRTIVGSGDVSVSEVGDTIEIAHADAGGDVSGPASSADTAVAVFDGATGKAIKESSAAVDASGNITTPGTVDGRDVSVDGAAQDAHIADGTIHFTQGRVADSNYGEVTSVPTVSATLEDITGLTFNITVPTGYTARIFANMAFSTSTTGGGPATGGWAVSINGVDGTVFPRYLSGLNDAGIGSVMARSAALGPGTYVVKGRHLRTSGSSTIVADVAQLWAFAITE